MCVCVCVYVCICVCVCVCVYIYIYIYIYIFILVMQVLAIGKSEMHLLWMVDIYGHGRHRLGSKREYKIKI
jgi:hypothetical protein